jgi:fatty acid desaturase
MPHHLHPNAVMSRLERATRSRRRLCARVVLEEVNLL